MAHFIYIHIPFCLKKCIYCDFNSVANEENLIGPYVSALCKDMEMRRDQVEELDAVYIGGGTPSILKAEDIIRIMDKLRGSYSINSAAEITLEANPGTLNDSNLRALLDAGINRISIGVQSLDRKELALLGRMHDAKEALEAFYAARKEGFRNISIDLIYGIPGQDLESWERTLATVIALRPEHISTYELTPENGTVLYEKIAAGHLNLPDEDTVVEMYYGAIDMLKANGYEHYEISNFALPGRQCRHNLNYWNRGEYLGIGAGAHSFLAGRRAANVADLRRYIHDMELGILPIVEETFISGRDETEETLFLGLRKIEGFDIELIAAGITEKFKEALDELSHQGLLEISGDRIRLTRKGLIVCNSVIVRLMICIEQSQRA